MEMKKDASITRLTWVLVSVLLVFYATNASALKKYVPTRKYEGTTIRVMAANDPYPIVLAKTIPEFEKLTGIKVKADFVGYVPSYHKMMIDFLSPVATYEVFGIDGPWFGEVLSAHRLMMLDELIETTPPEELPLDDITVAAKKALFRDGHWWMFPMELHGELLAYRKDLLEEVGAGPPKTPDDLVQLAMRFTRDTNGDGQIDQWGIAFNGQRGAPFGQDLMVTMYAFGSPLFDEQMHPVLDTSATRAAFEHMKTLTKYAPLDILNMAWDQRVREFMQGRVAMTYVWLGRANDIQDPAQSRVVGKVWYAPFPAVKEVPPFIVLGGMAWGMPYNIDVEKIGAAWEFLKWDASPAHKAEMVKLRAGPYFDLRSIIMDPELQQIQPELKIWAEWSHYVTEDARPPIPEYSILQETLGSIGHEGLSGKISVEETLKRIQERMDKVMRRAGYY